MKFCVFGSSVIFGKFESGSEEQGKDGFLICRVKKGF
jgi:hypothetical protein